MMLWSLVIVALVAAARAELRTITDAPSMIAVRMPMITITINSSISVKARGAGGVRRGAWGVGRGAWGVGRGAWGVGRGDRCREDVRGQPRFPGARKWEVPSASGNIRLGHRAPGRRGRQGRTVSGFLNSLFSRHS